MKVCEGVQGTALKGCRSVAARSTSAQLSNTSQAGCSELCRPHAVMNEVQLLLLRSWCHSFCHCLSCSWHCMAPSCERGVQAARKLVTIGRSPWHPGLLQCLTCSLRFMPPDSAPACVCFLSLRSTASSISAAASAAALPKAPPGMPTPAAAHQDGKTGCGYRTVNALDRHISGSATDVCVPYD